MMKEIGTSARKKGGSKLKVGQSRQKARGAKQATMHAHVCVHVCMYIHVCDF